MLDAYAYMTLNTWLFRQGQRPGQRDFREWREGETPPGVQPLGPAEEDAVNLMSDSEVKRMNGHPSRRARRR